MLKCTGLVSGTFIVPAGKKWKLKALTMILASDANGNCKVLDPHGNNVGQLGYIVIAGSANGMALNGNCYVDGIILESGYKIYGDIAFSCWYEETNA